MDEAFRLFALTTVAFLLFCLITGAVYLLNDVLDVEKDRNHPKKRNRPIASGALDIRVALGAALVLAAVGLGLAFAVEPMFALVAAIYLATMVAYSTFLKHVIIVDILAISAGFLLRAVAGAVVMDVTISPWLYVCTSLGALFLGFAKRLNELVIAGDNGALQRSTLDEYTPRFLEQLIAMVAPATLVSYIFYTFSAENLPENGSMMLTIPFVAYGLFRYTYLVQYKNLGESPEEVLLTDLPLIADIMLWLLTASAVLLVFR